MNSPDPRLVDSCAIALRIMHRARRDEIAMLTRGARSCMRAARNLLRIGDVPTAIEFMLWADADREAARALRRGRGWS